MRNTIEDHEGRIQTLEAQRIEQEKINNEIRNQLTTTENTVLKESGKQQELSQRLLDHVLKNDLSSRVSDRKRKAYTQQQIWKTVGLLIGSGGLIFLLVEKLISG
ncbi:hypothetical protein BTR22_18975 [Alkalihalophilus pseudofirmus]|uniref:hypothetical protein n=1 Tax=Alkalihalophilus pseudofirmus TaxID=79885 RepID=UPI000951FE69|nr:hypothetical protein BTR22_18975 [Alkalihalophilus pseudofirmus]